MKYVKVKWVHSLANEPVLLYSELNSDGWEVRKIEVYADGRKDYADSSQQSGEAWLSEEPLPPLEEIASDPQFEPTTIPQEEFESIWREAKGIA